jgi:hypothetical protein
VVIGGTSHCCTDTDVSDGTFECDVDTGGATGTSVVITATGSGGGVDVVTGVTVSDDLDVFIDEIEIDPSPGGLAAVKKVKVKGKDADLAAIPSVFAVLYTVKKAAGGLTLQYAETTEADGATKWKKEFKDVPIDANTVAVVVRATYMLTLATVHRAKFVK